MLKTEAQTIYAPAVHTHSTNQVTGLDTALAGKAAVSHTHTPSSIGAAAASHTHTANQITGILPVTKGGTGVSSIADLKTALGIDHLTGQTIYKDWGVSSSSIYGQTANTYVTMASSSTNDQKTSAFTLTVPDFTLEGTLGINKRIRATLSIISTTADYIGSIYYTSTIIYKFKVNGIQITIDSGISAISYGYSGNLSAYVGNKVVNIDNNTTYNKLIISDISCSLGEGTTNINTYNFNLPFYMNIEIEADVYNN